MLWAAIAAVGVVGALLVAWTRGRAASPAPCGPAPSEPAGSATGPATHRHPEFRPQNPLEELLEASVGAPERRPAFYRAFLESEVFVLPTPPAATPGVRVVERPTPLRLRSWDKDGTLMVAAYTSEARVAAAMGPETPFAALTGRTLLDSLGDTAGLVLNAGGPCVKEFAPEELAALKSGALLGPAERVTLPAGTRVRVGRPASVPRDFVERLSAYFRTRPEVAAAHLVAIAFGEGEPHLAVGIELVPGRLSAPARDTLLQDAAYVARSAAGDPPREVDLEVLEDAETDRLVRRTPPFYRA